MKQTKKVLELCCGVTAAMLTLSFVPPVSIGGTQLRKVDILSSLKTCDKTAATDSAKVQARILADGTYSTDIWPDSVTVIEDYSHGAAGGMNHFYAALNGRKSLGRPVRIAFLGDSFIEGDILAGNLREMLQSRFGVNGIGWIDAADKRNEVRPTIKAEAKGLTLHQVREKNIDYSICGLQMGYATLSGNCKVSLCGSKFMPHAATWQKASIFVRNNCNITLKAKINDQPEQTYTATPGKEMKAIDYKGNMNSLALSLSAACNKGNVMYGIALESRQGVVVDNFSIRGFSGDGIAKASKEIMQEFARLREYDLIIMEYGLNTANNKNTDLNYRLYTNKMKSVISLLREVYPEASILVMGVADRSERTADGFSTMPCIETMTSWQRQMAVSEKVAFYSLFQAMGGKNSMKQYVDSKYANKDYTHLTLKGGDRLARKVYSSIITGLNNYNLRTK